MDALHEGAVVAIADQKFFVEELWTLVQEYRKSSWLPQVVPLFSTSLLQLFVAYATKRAPSIQEVY